MKVKKGKFAQARAAVKAAKANAEMTQAALDKARIQESSMRLTAAFDGVVTRRTADPGNFVQVSDSRLLVPLVTVQSVDPVRLWLQLPGEYAGRLSRGDPVELYSQTSGRISGLRVTRFSPVLDREDRTMRVEIDVPNAEGRLLPGMDAKVTIHFQKVPMGTVVAPRSCLYELIQEVVGRSISWKGGVYVVRDGKAHRTPVTMGHIGADEVEIVQGVQASDLLVTDPKHLRGEVVPVEVKKAP